MNQKNNVAILNFWWAANYGANLTAYALQQLIQNSSLIDNSDFQQYLGDSKYKFHHIFAEKYLKTGKICRTTTDTQRLNYNTFIVGSDQVFRPKINKRIFDSFLLRWTNINSRKIAFSASFGVDKEKFLQENSSAIIEKMRNALKTFDFISVREKSGVEICKDLFNIDAEWIIDPVFILEKYKYIELVKNSTKDFTGKIVSYMFDKTNNKIDKFLTRKYKKEVFELWNSNSSVEDWLKAIYDSEFVITNSFHGVCFSLIFNKPFICLINATTGSTRYDSIFEILGIKNQCIHNIKEIYAKDCIFKIDYAKVNQRINEERQKGLDFLRKALETPVKITPEKIEAKIQFLENKVCELEKEATLKYQIKNEFWNLWLIIFHKYLPNPVKSMIRIVRDKICK